METPELEVGKHLGTSNTSKKHRIRSYNILSISKYLYYVSICFAFPFALNSFQDPFTAFTEPFDPEQGLFIGGPVVLSLRLAGAQGAPGDAEEAEGLAGR